MKQGIDHIGAAVAFFCHDGKGKFVFHKRSKKTRDQHGTWDCGGGGVEFGETLEEALWRELKEEYGCFGEIEQKLHPSSFIFENAENKVHWIAIPYVVRVDPKDVVIAEPENVEELGWFQLDNLPEPLHPGVKVDIETNWNLLKQYTKIHATYT